MQQIIVCPRSTNVHGYVYYLSAVLSCIWLKYFEQGLSSLDMSKKKSERAFATTEEKIDHSAPGICLFQWYSIMQMVICKLWHQHPLYNSYIVHIYIYIYTYSCLGCMVSCRRSEESVASVCLNCVLQTAGFNGRFGCDPSVECSKGILNNDMTWWQFVIIFRVIPNGF